MGGVGLRHHLQEETTQCGFSVTQLRVDNQQRLLFGTVVRFYTSGT